MKQSEKFCQRNEAGMLRKCNNSNLEKVTGVLQKCNILGKKFGTVYRDLFESDIFALKNSVLKGKKLPKIVRFFDLRHDFLRMKSALLNNSI